MNTERFKRQLLAKERELRARVGPSGGGNEPGDESVPDSGDESVRSEAREAQLRDAEADWAVLNQVRDALARIENGTYGHCLVDGEPIDPKRLEAIPWTPYCRKHQELLEKAGPAPRPTI